MTKHRISRPQKPLDQALLAAVQAVLKSAQTAMSDPALQTDEAIHEFRKSMKQWRAWLRLFEPALGDCSRSMREIARNCAKQLSSARDLRSSLDALHDLRTTSDGLSERTHIAIRERLEEMQKAAEKNDIGDTERAAIANEVRDWVAAVSDWPFIRIAQSDLLDALGTGYRRARRAVPKNWRHAEEEDLHELRRRTIDYRYQLELVHTLTAHRGAIDRAQALREALGSHRDLALLLKLAAPHEPLARFRSKLAPAIAQRQEEHLQQASKIAEKLYAEKPRAIRARLENYWADIGAEDRRTKSQNKELK
jgi:CHAD domain-containing protein